MADSIHVKLPDGSVKEVPKGTTALDIAKSISPRLADAALAAKTNGDLIDLTKPLEKDTDLRLLTEKDPEALEVYRHSSAHLLAAAVLELFPETKLGHGPPTESGFFYDFYRPTPFTPEDLEKIEKKMQELVQQNIPYAREFLPRDQGLAEFKKEGDFMKCHFIEQFTKPDEKISIYRTGKFTDFCRGPHIPSTGKIKAFKLFNIAGAYWLGDEKNPQLQRIYGTSFFSKKDLDDYLKQLEESQEARPPRAGPAARSVFDSGTGRAGTDFLASQGRHHPQRDGRLDARRVPEARLLAGLHAARGAAAVVLHLGARRLLRAEHVRRHGARRRRISPEADELSRPHSDLQRFAEVVSRSAGAAGRTGHGVPLRAFGRDARPAARARVYAGRCAHLLHAGADRRRDCQLPRLCAGCAEGFWLRQIPDRAFDLESRRPQEFRGQRRAMDSRHPIAGEGAERARKIEYKTIPGEAAFYGPKIDIKLVDAIGRLWQLSTVQFDFNLPQRFGLEYVAEDGSRKQPVMVHRALYGSVERFFGVLIEHYAGAFPVWLSPVQVAMIPISERHAEYANKVADQLKAIGVRVEVDARNEKMNAKIREHAMQKVPFLLVVGDTKRLRRAR